MDTASGSTGAGACSSACASAVSVAVDISAPPLSLLVRHVGQVCRERVQLWLGQSLPEVLRHDALPEALRDLGVRIDDRLADEGHVLALERGAEVGSDLPGGTGVGQRMATPAPGGAGEDLLADGVGRR